MSACFYSFVNVKHIANFNAILRHVHQVNSASTHYSCFHTSIFYSSPAIIDDHGKHPTIWPTHITKENVKRVILNLKPSEREIILNELFKQKPEKLVYCKRLLYWEQAESEQAIQENNVEKHLQIITEDIQEVPPKIEVFKLIIKKGMPFFIFGLLDNMMMTIFGDLIDSQIGPLGFTGLTSAALGNAVSDVISVVLAMQIQIFIEYTTGKTLPKLTEAQRKLKYVVWLGIIARPIGIYLGAIAGMWPLFFID